MRTSTDPFLVRFKPGEKESVRQKMKDAGIVSMNVYMRKSALENTIIRLDLSDVKEVSRLLRINANNLNQVARVANGTGCINPKRVEQLQHEMEEIWKNQKELLRRLSTIS